MLTEFQAFAAFTHPHDDDSVNTNETPTKKYE